MADVLVKPVETVAPAAPVAEPPAKQTNPSGQPKIVGPPSLYPSARISPAKPILAAQSDMQTELAEIKRAWRVYRSTNGRNAVYIYLSKAYQVVSRWQRLGCAVTNARAALRLRPNPPQMKPEPFAIAIFCTADSEIVDGKTRSKWARVLRYAAQAKPAGRRLIDFIKAKGGINDCLARR